MVLNSFLISCSCSVQEPQVCYRLSESALLKLNPILEEQLHLWTLGHGFLQRASGLAPTLHLLPGLLPRSFPPIHFPVLPPKQSCSFVHLITSFQISHSPCGPACSIYLLIDFAPLSFVLWAPAASFLVALHVLFFLFRSFNPFPLIPQLPNLSRMWLLAPWNVAIETEKLKF